MGERKCINKYYPPDFDPSKIPRNRRPNKNKQTKVRSMLSMSVRCKRCGNYMSRGTKFNARKESVVGENYLGEIQTLRFYLKCTQCSAEITIKTDPETAKKRRKREEDAIMTRLEKRRLDSKREMESAAALDEIMAVNSRRASIVADAVFESLQSRAALEKEKEETKKKKKKKLEDEEDDALIKSVVFRTSTRTATRRFHDDDDDDDDEVVATKPVVDETCNAEKPVHNSQFMVVIKNKKKPRVDDDDDDDEKKRTSLIALQSLCDNYNSEDDDDGK
ncbi:CWC16 protein [Trema orientale]|uniref:CWC16 protein n=1 Tax=Trema orientale TaxID=63057 RepID=A0A2P5F4N4_TREOI|nr:CWC16 protein [Trema orientale]